MIEGTPTHPKIEALAEYILADTPQLTWGQAVSLACGTMERLWHYTARYCPTGDLATMPTVRIASNVGYHKSSQDLIDTLVKCRLVDIEGDSILVHDWSKHCPDLVKRRLERQGIDRFADGSSVRHDPSRPVGRPKGSQNRVFDEPKEKQGIERINPREYVANVSRECRGNCASHPIPTQPEGNIGDGLPAPRASTTPDGVTLGLRPGTPKPSTGQHLRRQALAMLDELRAGPPEPNPLADQGLSGCSMSSTPDEVAARLVAGGMTGPAAARLARSTPGLTAAIADALARQAGELARGPHRGGVLAGLVRDWAESGSAGAEPGSDKRGDPSGYPPPPKLHPHPPQDSASDHPNSPQIAAKATRIAPDASEAETALGPVRAVETRPGAS